MESVLYFFIDQFSNLMDISLTVSIVILVVIGIRQLLKRAPKIFSYALWGIVLLRLLVPISIESPVSVVPDRTEHSTVVQMNEVLPEIEFETPQDRARNEWIRENTPPGEPFSQVSRSFNAEIYLTLVWLFGMSVMIAASVVSYGKLRKRVYVCVPFRKGIYIADDIDTPFVMGIFRPVIYLPGTLGKAERRYIIAHERHHIRRGDHIFKALGFLALTIHWFNPLVWVAFILAGRDMEMSCDEAVIRKYGEDVRADYSASLLNLATGHRLFAGTPLAFGEGDPTGRVRNLAKWKRPAFWVIFICVVLCIVLSVCLLTDPNGPNQESHESDAMTMVDFNRTMAHVKFYLEDDLEYHIHPAYSLETKINGTWQEMPRLAEKQPASVVAVVMTDDVDYDAWSDLRIEDAYGCLPDGTYRIKKDITISPNTDKSETESVYVEFTIGGTGEEYITYSLENITRTGANLYEHEKVDDSVALVYNEKGFWLESLHDGQWIYMEPTEDMNSFGSEVKYYIREVHYPSSHIELDWSDLYGELPNGTYRIAREITNTDPSVLRLCTVYKEFTIGETASEGSTISNDWGVSIKPDRVSRIGATALFTYSGSVPGEESAELTYGDFLSLDRLVDGKWVPCDELAGYDYFVGDSSYPVVDGYGMVHEWPDRFGELPDGHYRLGKQVTLTRSDGSRESRMVYGEFTLPGSVRTGLIPLNELPEVYSGEQAMIDGCFVTADGVARENKELFREFVVSSWNGIPGMIRIVNWYYGEDPNWYAVDLSYDGSTYTITTKSGADTTRYMFRYLKYFTGEKAWENADHNGYEYYILANDDAVTLTDIDGNTNNALDYWVLYTEFTYQPKRPQLPANPAQAVLEFNGAQLVSITDFDRLEKIWILFEDAELLSYEPKTHSIGVGLNLVLKSQSGESLTIELNPDSDICRINGEYVFYGAFDEPDYIEKLWYYLGIPSWPESVYEKYPNAYRP